MWQLFMGLPWVRRQREVVLCVQAQLLQMALQLLGGLWEVTLPPIPVVRGASQRFNMCVLAVQGAQHDRKTRFEFWRESDDLSGAQAQFGLVVRVPRMAESPPLFE